MQSLLLSALHQHMTIPTAVCTLSIYIIDSGRVNRNVFTGGLKSLILGLNYKTPTYSNKR